MTEKKRKRGAPEKVIGGLSEVIYIRADQALVNGIDVLLEKDRLGHPGRTLSRSDLIREILWRAVVEDGENQGGNSD